MDKDNWSFLHHSDQKVNRAIIFYISEGYICALYLDLFHLENYAGTSPTTVFPVDWTVCDYNALFRFPNCL